MNHDALQTFIEHVRAAFDERGTDRAALVRSELARLAQASPDEPWLRSLHALLPASQELYRDPVHGFVLLAHSEPTGLYRPPHDHGRCWVVYALHHGEMEVGTYDRAGGAGGARLVARESSRLGLGEARVYATGDVHDTRCARGPSIYFRFTERDLKVEEREGRLTRFVARDGVWSAGNA